MAVVEFQYQPSRFAKLVIGVGTTQADITAVFQSVDTSNWHQRPAWDGTHLRWQILQSPYGVAVDLVAGDVVAVERPYVQGVPVASPSTAPAVFAYTGGSWSDAAVTYL